MAFHKQTGRLEATEIVGNALRGRPVAKVDAGFDVATLGGVSEVGARHERSGAVNHDALCMEARPLVSRQERPRVVEKPRQTVPRPVLPAKLPHEARISSIRRASGSKSRLPS